MNRANGGIVGKDNLFLGSYYPSALGVFDSRGQEMRMRVGRYPARFDGFASWQPPNYQFGANWAAFQTALQALNAATTITDTLSTPTGTYPGSSAYYGGVLLPDGSVFCVPCNATSARIYNPVTDTLTTPTGTYPGGTAYTGGVLLPDGRVFCVPSSTTSARIYGATVNTAPLDYNMTTSPYFNKF